MKDDCIFIIAGVSGIAYFVLGIILACVTSTADTTRRHHRDARDLHGRVTCEYCKELMKGSSHEQR